MLAIIASILICISILLKYKEYPDINKLLLFAEILLNIILILEIFNNKYKFTISLILSNAIL